MVVEAITWGLVTGAALGALFLAISWASYHLDSRNRRSPRLRRTMAPRPTFDAGQAGAVAANVISLDAYRRAAVDRSTVAGTSIDEQAARMMHPSMRGMQSAHASRKHS